MNRFTAGDGRRRGSGPVWPGGRDVRGIEVMVFRYLGIQESRRRTILVFREVFLYTRILKDLNT